MDIVTRLRKAQQTFYGDTSINELHMYAADEIERLREALQKIADSQVEINAAGAWSYCVFVAQTALQQKDSE